MLIPLQEAAAFIKEYYPVFDELWRRREESLTDVELIALISAAKLERTPSYILGQLKRMRFIIEADVQVGSWELAPSFVRWIEHLQQMARPVSSVLVRGRLTELEHHLVAFRLADSRRDLAEGRDILRDTRAALQSLGEDLGQTRTAIIATVSEVKSEHRKQNAADRFRRINRLWTEYLLPMLDLVDPTGPLEAVCAAWERQLTLSLENKYLPERRLAERIENEMQNLRVTVRERFRECRNELAPLHARLRRETMWAEGAACILAQIEREGATGSSLAVSFPVSTFRYAGQISSAALVASAARWLDLSESPPVIDFDGGQIPPDSQAVEDILAAIETLSPESYPIEDLLPWLDRQHGTRGFHPVLQVFSHLVTDTRYNARFTQPISEYLVAGGIVRCGRVKLEIRQSL